VVKFYKCIPASEKLKKKQNKSFFLCPSLMPFLIKENHFIFPCCDKGLLTRENAYLFMQNEKEALFNGNIELFH